MADDSWYPGKNAWAWGKEKVKKHPALTGALVGGVIIASGGLAIPIVVAGAAAGAAIGSNIAKDPGNKEEVKK